MAHLMSFCCRKVLLLFVLLFLFVSVCFSACSKPQLESTLCLSRRVLEAEKEEQEKPLKKKPAIQLTKNNTKLIKPSNVSSKNQTKTIKSDNLSSKNQTKTIKSNNLSSKNQTKTIKSYIVSTKNQTKTVKSNDITTKTIKSNNLSSKNQTKQLKVTSNSSSKTTTFTDSGLKKLNSTKSTSKITSNKTSDHVKASNKTTKATASSTSTLKQTKTTKLDQIHQEANKKDIQSKKKVTKQAPPSWLLEEEDEYDLVSEFKDLPNKFHRTLIPDLERISTTSKAYITKANDEITKGFKPYVGKKYASTVAAVTSCAFVLIPLLLVSLLCTRIKAYFSLQKILIFIQVYLSIYFTILCVASLVTGIEPLKFLFSTSQSTYLFLQVLQTLAYIFYLLLLLMHLVLVFSTECGLGSKFLGLAQTFVGFAVGLHYYVTVFHRVVLRQPPKTNWKIHGIYATCFLLVCLLARADRRKKAYVEDGGGEGKQN